MARKDNFLRAFSLADLDATIIGQSESATQSEAAMLKALAANNPLLMDKTQLDLDLRRMQNQADSFDASKEYHANVVSQGNRMIGTLMARIKALEAAAAQVCDTSGEAFEMKVTSRDGRLEDQPIRERKHAVLRLSENRMLGDLRSAPLGHPFLIGELGGVRLYAWAHRPFIGKPGYQVGVDDPRNTREWAPDLLDLDPAELEGGRIDAGAISRLENLVRSIQERPGVLSARVERLRKDVAVSAGEQETTFEAADELAALKERGKALTELMRLVAEDRPPARATASGAPSTDPSATGPSAEVVVSGEVASVATATDANDDAASSHAALAAEAEAAYKTATQTWRELRDARLDAPGNVKAAEMGAVRTSRRRVKQQMAERAREARGVPAPRPRIRVRDASADLPSDAGGLENNPNPTPNGSSAANPRPAIAPPAPPSAPPSGIVGATARLGWSR